jgi:hypothetical protein
MFLRWGCHGDDSVTRSYLLRLSSGAIDWGLLFSSLGGTFYQFVLANYTR